jgi:post-segregation antitoxin (ccd killing protein)
MIAVNNASNENLEAEAKVFPNPSNDAFEVVVDRLASETAKVQVLNVSGQVVYEGTMNNGKVQINTAAWNTGVYMLSVEGANYHYSTKVMVRH